MPLRTEIFSKRRKIFTLPTEEPEHLGKNVDSVIYACSLTRAGKKCATNIQIVGPGFLSPEHQGVLPISARNGGTVDIVLIPV